MKRKVKLAVFFAMAAATLVVGRAGNASSPEATTLRAGPTTVWLQPSPVAFFHADPLFRGSRGAQLTAGGEPVVGRSVSFYSKDPETGALTLRCLGTTRWDGLAHCSNEHAWGGTEKSLEPFVAVFEGDDDYLPSSDEGTLLRVLDVDAP